ncbi:MAG TPA: dihydrofolate reductase family protein, partial [Methanothrix sp.]|nr:dihydrofolate reductase family protein [Methanothrix sp.]
GLPLATEVASIRPVSFVKVVRVDAGGTLNGLLLRQGQVAEMSLLVYPSLVGEEKQKGIFADPRLPAANSPDQRNAISLKLLQVQQLEGEVVWLRYEITPNDGP